MGSRGGCAPCGSSLGGELVTLPRGDCASARYPLLGILPNDNFVDHLKPPFPSAALDQPLTGEMVQFLTGADIRNYRSTPEDVAERLRPLLQDAAAHEAIDIVHRDFLDLDAVGPRRVAEFLAGKRDDTIQADVVGFIRALLRRVDERV